MKLRPITISAAKEFVRKHHRHNRPPVSALFAIAAELDGEIVGVAMVGRPVARALQDGFTAEVTRCCTNGFRNATSFLYSKAKRAAQALGYRRVLTYTLQTETGASLRAVTRKEPVPLAARAGWSCPSRPRHEGTVDQQAKLRWEL